MPEPPPAWGPPPAPAAVARSAPNSPGDRPARPGTIGPWLFAAGVTVVALVLVAGAVVAAAQLWRSGYERVRDEAAAAREAEEAARVAAEDRPELREVVPVSTLGPVWEPGAVTFTMAFPHWPFAFRTPPHWDCLKVSYDPIPQAEAWGCAEGVDVTAAPRVHVLLRACPTTCTEAEQQEMIETWLDEPEDAVHHEHLPTAYVEIEQNDRGNYAVDLSHFVVDPDDPGGPLRWHIGVYAEAVDDDTRDVVLKILNDILSQAS